MGGVDAERGNEVLHDSVCSGKKRIRDGAIGSLLPGRLLRGLEGIWKVESDLIEHLKVPDQ